MRPRFDDVKARVTERLAAMTGLEVAGVNLRIGDVITPEEYASTAPASTNNLPKGIGLFWQVLSAKTLNGRPRNKSVAGRFICPDVVIPLV